MRKILLLTSLLLLPVMVLAQTERPPELAPYIHAAKPYGQGTLTKLWIHAYDAALWTDAKEWSMAVPFALTLHYGSDFSSDSLVSRSISEMHRSETLSKEQIASYTEQLGKIFPDVREGDVITALYLPKKGAIFFYNGKPSGSIKDNAFATRFLSIWLSPETSEPKLRQELLGKS